MIEHEAGPGLEQQIAQWRSYLRRRRAIHAVDVEELEDHLRGQFATLVDAGLAPDEAFLVAVKRMGDLDERLLRVEAPARPGHSPSRRVTHKRRPAPLMRCSWCWW